MTNGIERIEKDGKLFALIVRHNFEAEGCNFISDVSHSFQVAYHSREQGYHYKAHVSLPFEYSNTFNPNKAYLVKSGKIGINIFNEDNYADKLAYVELFPGDLIIFISGGHDVDILTDGKFIEIKQGPYRREGDKRFLE